MTKLANLTELDDQTALADLTGLTDLTDMATFCSLEIVADMIKIAKRIITPLKVKFLHKKTFYVLRLSECPKF